MAESIRNPAKCEVLALIRTLHVKGETAESAAEIQRKLFYVYGEDVMLKLNVAK
jgi:hypothetical protein